MRRREFIALVGCAAMMPRTAVAQPGDRPTHIGALMGYAASDPEGRRLAAAFEQALRDLGWTPSQNLRIEYRWGAGDLERFRAFAAELVALAPRAIFVHSSTALKPVLQRTGKIPIVFVNVADPVGQGFVKSLSRPGGNVTGFTNFEFTMGEKWLEMLKGIAPATARAAVVYNPQTTPYFRFFWDALVPAAASFAMQLIDTPVREVAQIDEKMVSLGRQPGGGLIVLPDVFTSINRNEIVAIAARHRVPAVYPFRFFASSGGLMSYGTETTDLFRRAAAYVDRVLKGANPGELPVQTPAKFEFVINLKTAKELGLTAPPALLARADEVIE